MPDSVLTLIGTSPALEAVRHAVSQVAPLQLYTEVKTVTVRA
jgi:hypothetical protein